MEGKQKGILWVLWGRHDIKRSYGRTEKLN